MNVGFAGPEEKKTSSIAKDVDVATPKSWRTSTDVLKVQCITIVPFVLSICLIPREISRFWDVVTQCIYNAPKIWGCITDTHALYVLNPYVTCPTCGRNLMKRLLPTQCQKCTKTRWYGYFAMTVVQTRMFGFIWLRISALAAVHTTLDRRREGLILLTLALQEFLRLLVQPVNQDLNRGWFGVLISQGRLFMYCTFLTIYISTYSNPYDDCVITF